MRDPCDYAILANANPCRLHHLYEGCLLDEDANEDRLERFRAGCRDSPLVPLCVTNVAVMENGRDRYHLQAGCEEECDKLIAAVQEQLGSPHLWTIFRTTTCGGAFDAVQLTGEATDEFEDLSAGESKLITITLDGTEKKCLYIDCD